MIVDPARVAFYQPGNLQKFKLDLFRRVGSHIVARGGCVVINDPVALDKLVKGGRIPVVGCSPELRLLIQGWQASGQHWVYWDRAYCRRVFATWLPRGDHGGFYRWHIGSFQTQRIRDVPDDRWRAWKTEVRPWQKNGKHIVIAAPTITYGLMHETRDWIAETIRALALVTDRQLVIRDKESKRSLQADLEGAHALVTHGSNSATEAVIMGCPVFVHRSSAASLVGRTDLRLLEAPIYPERQPWLNTLAYSCFNEQELVDGTLWRLLD